MNRQVISALIGLVGAVGNSGKTADTDRVIISALLSVDTLSAVDEIHREKHRISPGCASCPTPCGNTSDYDIAGFELTPPDILGLKESVSVELVKLAARRESEGILPEEAMRAIAYLGYDLEKESYLSVLEELKNA